MAQPDQLTPEYDSPWKEIIEFFFPQFMAFFFPAAHAAIDWTLGYTFLDKEFQKITRTAQTGKRYVDKLVQVHLRSGEQTWVLIHIEVQAKPEADFPQRIFIYYYRIFDTYQRRIASLAILSDDDPNWRPTQFRQELFGCQATLDFPTVKLLDYQQQVEQLSQNPNPFAVVVMAHLQTLQTRHDSRERYAAKLNLAKMLYRRGYDRSEILRLFHFIDWIMTLPTHWDEQFQVELMQFEAEVRMQYVSGIERRAIERGWQKGLAEGRQTGLQEGLQEGLQQGTLKEARTAIQDVLVARFGEVATAVSIHLEPITDIELLRRWLRQAVTLPTLDDFLQILPSSD